MCGEKNCRKIIRAVKFLPQETFEKYKGSIQLYFRGVYTPRKKH